MEVPNYYSILQIPSNVSIQEIKKSFRALSKKYHPDVNNGNKEFDDRFKDILNAYEVLSDSGKREKYDNWLSYTNNIDYSDPYEPKYRTVNDVIRITKELKDELFKHDPQALNINVNLVYNIINHVLNPDFIYSEINSKDDYSKGEIVTNIVNCYTYLPLGIIELIQIKLDLINYRDEKIQTFIRKIIRKKKILEEVNSSLAVDNHGIGCILLIALVAIIIIIIGWIAGLLH
jgi:hypothetical protein